MDVMDDGVIVMLLCKKKKKKLLIDFAIDGIKILIFLILAPGNSLCEDRRRSGCASGRIRACTL